MADDSDLTSPKPPSATTDESKLTPAPASPALEVPPEVLSQLPARVQQLIGFSATMGLARSGPDRLLERIPEGQAAEVVGRIVSQAEKALELQHAERIAAIQARERQQVTVSASEERRHVRILWFSLAVIVLGVGLAGVCVLAGKDELAKALLTLCVGLVGGYGLGRGTRDKGRS
jgi:hypothetical protein